jgi:hypothetical protein
MEGMHMRLLDKVMLTAMVFAMLMIALRHHDLSHVIRKKIVPTPVIVAKKIVRPADPELTRILDAIKEILNK